MSQPASGPNPFTPGTDNFAIWERQEAQEHGSLHRGQLRIAEQFLELHDTTLRYAHGLGWFQWIGTRWAGDTTGHARRCVVDTLKHLLRSMPDLPNREERKKLDDDIRKCESATGTDGVLKLASCMRPFAIEPRLLDADPWLFNVENGTFDLRTGMMRAHNPADHITKIAGCGFDLSSPGVRFQQFIEEILPDEDVRLYVQRLLGSAMQGGIRDHILPIFTG